MPEIVLMVPSPTGYSASAQSSAMKSLAGGTIPGTLPWIAGECQLMDYYKMLLVESVEWNISVSEEAASTPRRTTHLPNIEAVKMNRRIDSASSVLNRWALNSHVSTDPWQVYFLRTMAPGSEGPTRGCFMTMTLHNPLITKYEFDVGEGDIFENIEVSATQIEWTYQLVGDNQLSTGQKTIGYDMQTGMVS